VARWRRRVWKAIRSPAKKDNFARAPAVTHLAQPLGKLRRGLMLSPVVEEDNGCGGIQREFAE